jgi:hypothetical protein
VDFRIRKLLTFFSYDHLDEQKQAIVIPFADLAAELAADDTLELEEQTMALRKLLEAKDCAVRASL